MFAKDKLSRDGVQAQALVLEKRVYASGVESGRASACRYQLRVKFEDGSTAEVTRHAFGYTLASAAVGDLIPVRYDPADRSKVEIDRHALAAQHEARARERDAQAIARGERALDQPASGTTRGDERGPDTGELRIGDADRELIGSVLSRHMTEGRLTVDELDSRLGKLYAAQTRDQARAVLAGLPPLTPSAADGEQHEPVPALPDWTTPAPRPGPGVASGPPTDEEVRSAYEAWRARVTKAKADKAAHKRAEATGDRKETFLAFRRLAISRAEEKSARAKFDQLRKRRPDWTAP